MGLNDANLRFYWEILPLLSPEIVGKCASASRFPLEVHHYSAIPPCPTRLLTARPPLPHSYVRLPIHLSLLDEQTTSLSRQNPRFHHLLSQGLYKSSRLLLKNAQLSRKTRGLSRESPHVFTGSCAKNGRIHRSATKSSASPTYSRPQTYSNLTTLVYASRLA